MHEEYMTHYVITITFKYFQNLFKNSFYFFYLYLVVYVFGESRRILPYNSYGFRPPLCYLLRLQLGRSGRLEDCLAQPIQKHWPKPNPHDFPTQLEPNPISRTKSD